MNEILLQEAVLFTSDLKIDEEAAIVYDVKILGPVSKNKLSFPLAVREAAHAIMEGSFVNFNHTNGKTDVPLESRFGFLKNVREDHVSDCTRANLHYFKDHAHAKHFINMARVNPKACGLSILGDARGDKTKRDSNGNVVVQSITNIKSFDLVADPANTLGLKESEDPPPPVQEEKKASDEYSADGCLNAIRSIIDSEGSSSEKLKLIEEHINQLNELNNPEEEEMAESTREQTRKELLQLCESLDYKTPEENFLILLEHTAKEHRVALINKKKLVKKPKSGSPAPIIPLEETTKLKSDEEVVSSFLLELRK